MDGEDERLRARCALLEAERERLPLALVRFDAAHRVLEWNPAAEALFGWTRDEALGREGDSLILPEQAPEWLDGLMTRLRAGDMAAHSVNENLTKDGRVILCEWYNTPHLDADGAYLGHTAMGFDVTAREQAKAELARQQGLLGAVFDHAPVMLVVFDAANRLVRANRHWQEMTGYRGEEITDWGVFGPDGPDPELGNEIYASIVRADGHWRDFLVRTRDGRLRNHSWAVVPAPGGAKVAVGVDVTERERALAEAERQRALLQTVFDHAPVMLSLADPDGRIHTVNRVWEETLGWRLDEIPGWDVFSPNWPERDPDFHDAVVAFIREASSDWHDFVARDRDGRRIDVAWAMVTGPGGLRIGIGQDVTRRKNYERQLQDLSRRVVAVQEAERAHLARELHDEVGQVLSAVIVNLHAARDDPATVDDCVEAVRAAIEQVRDLALRLRPAMLDVLGLGATLRWLVDRTVVPAGLTVHTDLRPSEHAPPDDLAIACYRVAQEALTNIVRHAKARNVWVMMEQQDDTSITVEVRDDGVGFDPDVALSRAGRGESLGLLGIRERVELFEGRLDVESAPGQGARIRVWFPVKAAGLRNQGGGG